MQCGVQGAPMISRTTQVDQSLQTPASEVVDSATSRSSFIPAYLLCGWTTGLRRVNARWKELISEAFELVASNTGLLLVAASQFFFSLMNLAVKKLTTIDPPVPALEVSVLHAD